MKWRKETCYVGYDRRGFACAVVLREHVRWLLIPPRYIIFPGKGLASTEGEVKLINTTLAQFEKGKS